MWTLNFNLPFKLRKKSASRDCTEDLFSSSFIHHNSYIKIKISLEIMLLSFWANWAVIWCRGWGTDGTGSQLHSLPLAYVRPHLGLCSPELWEPFGEFTENLCCLRTGLSSEGNFRTHWSTFFKSSLVFDLKKKKPSEQLWPTAWGLMYSGVQTPSGKWKSDLPRVYSCLSLAGISCL